MGTPYVGEIRMFGGNFAPEGWALCQGQLLAISENEALFQLIGTTYGGDGQTTFALPDLQSRLPVHQGTGPSGTTFPIGQMGGVETVTLTVQQIPVHSHALAATAGAGSTTNPAGNLLARGGSTYIQGDPDAALNPATVAPAGGSQPHDNLQPYLCINFIISLFGVFPQQT
jgi:microcystin-dependent protein